MILVTAGLIFKDGKLLIAQRPAGKHGALKWEFPGGKVEENEDPRACLAREIREEMAVEIRVENIVETVFHRYPDRSVLLLFYRCSWLSGEPKTLECAAFDWAKPSDLPNYDFLEADLDFIRKLATGTL
jgi:8-oxo-dGTP diphosphatase